MEALQPGSRLAVEEYQTFEVQFHTEGFLHLQVLSAFFGYVPLSSCMARAIPPRTPER